MKFWAKNRQQIFPLNSLLLEFLNLGTVECFARFCFVVKTSADKMILQICDIFSYDFSLFSIQLTLFRPKNSIGFKKRQNSYEKMSKICKIILSADVFTTKQNLGKHSTVYKEALLWAFVCKYLS